MKKVAKRIYSSVSRILPDLIIEYVEFYRKHGYIPDFRSPRVLNEKIAWLKLNERSAAMSDLVDKYEVRKWIASRTHSEHLAKLYGLWSHPHFVKLDKLPNKFVVKTTHDSGGVFIIKDKNKCDWPAIQSLLLERYAVNYYNVGREWAYRNVVPRVMVEELLLTGSGEVPEDYKVFCFDGEPLVVQVDSGRFREHTRDFFDRNGKLLNFGLHYPRSGVPPVVGRQFKRYIDLAKKIATGLKFCRVDGYIVDDRIVFGEITLYPGNAGEQFSPPAMDSVLGACLKLDTHVI